MDGALTRCTHIPDPVRAVPPGQGNEEGRITRHDGNRHRVLLAALPSAMAQHRPQRRNRWPARRRATSLNCFVALGPPAISQACPPVGRHDPVQSLDPATAARASRAVPARQFRWHARPGPGWSAGLSDHRRGEALLLVRMRGRGREAQRRAGGDRFASGHRVDVWALGSALRRRG